MTDKVFGTAEAEMECERVQQRRLDYAHPVAKMMTSAGISLPSFKTIAWLLILEIGLPLISLIRPSAMASLAPTSSNQSFSLKIALYRLKMLAH